MRKCVFRCVCVCVCVMNNAWVTGLTDVGCWVSSLPTEGLDVRCQTNSQLQRVWSGLAHIWTENSFPLSKSLTSHAVFVREHTGRCVTAGFGWREASLSTPVFAAVIRGVCYFWGAGGRLCVGEPHETYRGNSEGACSSCVFWVWTLVESSKWSVNTNKRTSCSRPLKSWSWSAHADPSDMTANTANLSDLCHNLNPTYRGYTKTQVPGTRALLICLWIDVFGNKILIN